MTEIQLRASISKHTIWTKVKFFGFHGLGNNNVYSTVANTHMHFGDDNVYIMYSKDIMSVYDPIAEISPPPPQMVIIC